MLRIKHRHVFRHCADGIFARELAVILDLGFPHRDIRVYADVTQTDLTETLDIPVYTYGRNKAR